VTKNPLRPASAALAVAAAALLAACGSTKTETVTVTHTQTLAPATTSSSTTTSSSSSAGPAKTTTSTSPTRSTTSTTTTPAATSTTPSTTTTRTETGPAFVPTTPTPTGELGVAVALLQRKGYTPLATSAYHAGDTLRVLIGRAAGGERAFFFDQGTYLGTDAAAASGQIAVLAHNDTEVTLGYGIYRAGQSAPSTQRRVRFALDMGQLSPLDPIPSVALRR
jgi:hypothetical protein